MFVETVDERKARIEATYNRKLRQLNFYNDSCGMCGTYCAERNLTRRFEPAGIIDLCPACCHALGLDSIKDWPESLMFGRWDRYPFRPEDYS